jgi:hypothetical protein
MKTKPLALPLPPGTILLMIFKYPKSAIDSVISGYEFLRELIPLPEVKRLDKHINEELDAIELQTTRLGNLHSILANFKNTDLFEDYSVSFL